MDDTFTLYDLKVEVVAGDRPMVCSHKVGDYFLVQGENLVFPKITRVGKRIQSHGQCTVVPLMRPDAGKYHEN